MAFKQCFPRPPRPSAVTSAWAIMKWWTTRVSCHKRTTVESNGKWKGEPQCYKMSQVPLSEWHSTVFREHVHLFDAWQQRMTENFLDQEAISSHQKDTIDLRRLPILISELVLGFSRKLNAWNIPKSFTIQHNFRLAKSPQSVLQVTLFSSSSLGERKPLWPRSSTKCRIQN